MKEFGILIAGLVAVFGLSSGTVSALNYKVGALEIDNPWSPAVPKGAKVAAGYMKIKNTGTEPDRLAGGSTPVAGRFEIHEMSIDKGVMKMRPLPNLPRGEQTQRKQKEDHQ
jgi:periplasmic copper chaperone A